MKILLVNPNTSRSVTDRLRETALSVAAPGTEVLAVTAARGVPYIATRAEAVIGGGAALDLLAEHWRSADAAVIAAFGDPGLGGARELFPIPVVGMAEAAMLTACMLGRRFAIISFARALGPWYQECVDYHGLGHRLAGIRLLGDAVGDIATVQEDCADALVDLAVESVRRDEADVVVLAGAPLSGLAARVRERIPVPVVDGIAAALKQAEALAALQPRKATAGTFRRPDPKTSVGLTEPLARWIAHTGEVGE